jgi:ribonuclease Z
VLTSVRAGPFTVRGVSVGGVYTALSVPELSIGLDVGLAPRSFAGVRHLFLSHGHVDHSGALPTLLGIRGLVGVKTRLKLFLPAEIVEPIEHALAAMTALQRYDLDVEAVGMNPGDLLPLHSDVSVRAFRTLHPVPSLGYQFVRKVRKLHPSLHGAPGAEIERRRHAGEDIFIETERLELAYATDTLAKVLDREPSLYQSRVLILECTFLDERKPVEEAWAGCHIHLDDLLERADQFQNEHLVLMHFSQIYRPEEVRELLRKRCPPALFARIVPFAPSENQWPG